jgi:multicomponent Na+:H+ antiporter subunit E
MKQKFITFLLTLLAWVIFAGRISVEVIVIGSVASLFTTILFSGMLFRHTNRKSSWIRYLRSFIYIILFIPVFFYEALMSALKVSRHVFERQPSFSPGIVRVRTHLTNVTALTILANLITLTPGTLTLDFDIRERVYYIHWIDVTTREEAEARKEIIEKFERWLDVIFK